jgi:small GTP-binding protein
MTIGINFMYKVTKIDDLKIKMQIWDTAGQDKYKTITQNYYKNCNGAFVVFSIDSKESFYSVSNFGVIVGNWIEDLAQAAPETTQVMLVGNKMDLEGQREVSS